MKKLLAISLMTLMFASCGKDDAPDNITVNPGTNNTVVVPAANVFMVRCYRWRLGTLKYGPVQATGLVQNMYRATVTLYPSGSQVNLRGRCVQSVN